MSDDLSIKIQADMKDAMRAKAVFRLGTVRLLLAAIKQREIDERIKLDDTQILVIIDKMIKQRNESIKQFEQGNRPDLAAKELAEITILREYLPQALTEDEITTLVKEAIATTNSSLLKDMAQVMAYIKPRAQGKADMGKISLLVKSQLQ
jgi:hypothetical protein